MEKFNQLIKGTTPVLVDFYATWCGPCKTMHPILEDLKKELGDRIHILKVDVDRVVNRKITDIYQIKSVPTLMLFREGKMVWHQSGVVSVLQLKENIEKYGK